MRGGARLAITALAEQKMLALLAAQAGGVSATKSML